MIYILAAASIIVLLFLIKRPSNNRDWRENHKILSTAKINGNEIKIHNIRHCTYKNRYEYTTNYYDKTFGLEKLKSASIMVIDTQIRLMTHVFLSFEFEDKSYVSISVEVRHLDGPDFPFLKIFLRQRELIYVIADERDVIQLRTNYKDDPFYMYPVKASSENLQKLFVDMLHRANNLKERPEFWNPITNTCTTNIVDHVNKISPRTIPFNWKLIITDNIDKYFYKLGLIDNSLPFEEMRKKYRINKQAQKHADDPDFSKKIRETN